MEQNDFNTTQMDSKDRLRNLYFQSGDTIVGRYEFVRELGHGGMGRVYLCRDTMANGRLMAVKTVPDILRDDHDAVAMLQREYDNMFNLTNDGIVAVRNLIKDDFRYYVVMDYAEGETLETYLKRVCRPDPSVTFEVARRLAAALDYANGKGMVHRDVKPGNVMVQIDGNNVKSVKLMDFGLGLHIRESMSHVSGVMTSGTPAYKSPEQWWPDHYDNKLTKQSDQYSLAALVYEMLAGTGHYPFHNYDLATFPNAVLTVPPKRLEDQTDYVNDALRKALAKKPEDRFEICTAFMKAMTTKPEAKITVQLPKTVDPPKPNVPPVASLQMEPKPQLALNAMNTEGKTSKRWMWILPIAALIGVLALIAGLSAEREKIKGEDKTVREKVVEAVKDAKDKVLEDVKGYLKNVEEIIDEDKNELHLKINSYQQGEDRVVELNGVKMVLKRIKAGTFMMGSPMSEDDRGSNEHQHRVTLTKDYWLGETEVTQEQYWAVTGKNPSGFIGGAYPVECVSWEEAMAFCKMLTKKERENGTLPAGYEYTLPTEAQWEYACRVGTTTPFSFGSTLNGDKANCNGNYPYGTDEGKYLFNTTAVGRYAPNVWGLYDMHGNVWEWCRDSCDFNNGVDTDTYRDDIMDPLCNRGAERVLRGGSWYTYPEDCRSAVRGHDDPMYRSDDVGFRVALAPVQ